MSKAGKVLGQAAESVMHAGGTVTKRGGEAMSSLGKAMGVSEDNCERMEEKADNLGKDMYYAGKTVGKKVENFTDSVESEAKEMYYSVKNKINK